MSRGPTFPPFRSRKDALAERRCAHDGRGSAASVPTHPLVRQRGRALLPEVRLPQGLHLTVAARLEMQRLRASILRHRGTIFADRKRPLRDYLLAIAIFVNGAKGHSALQLSRDLDCQYKTAFVLAHKIREAIGDVRTRRARRSGDKEIDGAYFGGDDQASE